MAILDDKPVYVFEQNANCWFRWSYTIETFVRCEEPIIRYENFAGIGTREINENGIKAIRELYERTFKKDESI